MQCLGNRRATEARARRWLLALLLMIPVFILYAGHVVHGPAGFGPTGFIQEDQLYYVANARKHFDGAFSLVYGNPFSLWLDTPRIYFQPASLLLGTSFFLTGADPGLVYVVFGFLAGLVFVRIAVALFERLFGPRQVRHVCNYRPG